MANFWDKTHSNLPIYVLHRHWQPQVRHQVKHILYVWDQFLVSINKWEEFAGNLEQIHPMPQESPWNHSLAIQKKTRQYFPSSHLHRHVKSEWKNMGELALEMDQTDFLLLALERPKQSLEHGRPFSGNQRMKLDNAKPPNEQNNNN
jgi:hypothetical protein